MSQENSRPLPSVLSDEEIEIIAFESYLQAVKAGADSAVHARKGIKVDHKAVSLSALNALLKEAKVEQAFWKALAEKFALQLSALKKIKAISQFLESTGLTVEMKKAAIAERERIDQSVDAGYKYILPSNKQIYVELSRISLVLNTWGGENLLVQEKIIFEALVFYFQGLQEEIIQNYLEEFNETHTEPEIQDKEKLRIRLVQKTLPKTFNDLLSGSGIAFESTSEIYPIILNRLVELKNAVLQKRIGALKAQKNFLQRVKNISADSETLMEKIKTISESKSKIAEKISALDELSVQYTQLYNKAHTVCDEIEEIICLQGQLELADKEHYDKATKFLHSQESEQAEAAFRDSQAGFEKLHKLIQRKIDGLVISEEKIKAADEGKGAGVREVTARLNAQVQAKPQDFDEQSDPKTKPISMPKEVPRESSSFSSHSGEIVITGKVK